MLTRGKIVALTLSYMAFSTLFNPFSLTLYGTFLEILLGEAVPFFGDPSKEVSLSRDFLSSGGRVTDIEGFYSAG